MSRIGRIGILVFAVMLGLAANSLYQMHLDGTLMEQYNSERKASITVAAVSLLALISLGIYERRRMDSVGRHSNTFGLRRYTDDTQPAPPENGSSCIYDTGNKDEQWQERGWQGFEPLLGKPKRDIPDTWMAFLKMFSVCLPCVYIVALLLMYAYGVGQSVGVWVFGAVGCVIVIMAGITAFGVYHRKSWAMSLGYLLAILNLLIFPIGTVIGLLLLIGVVGASPRFKRKSKSRRRRLHKLA